MSAEHHHGPEDQEKLNRLLDQFLNQAKPSFPAGRITPNDAGALAFAVALDLSKRAVVINFGKPVDWIGLGKNEAEMLGNLLLEKAKQL